MDARIVRSQNALKDAMAELIAVKEPQKITVVEICKKANVNRATFYKYYESPMDLLGKMEDDILLELENSLKKERSDEPGKFAKLILEEIKKHADLYSLVFFGEGSFLLRKKFVDVLENEATYHLRRYFPNLNDVQIKLVYYFMVSGCFGTAQVKMAGGLESLTLDEISIFSHAYANYMASNGVNFSVEGIDKDIWRE